MKLLLRAVSGIVFIAALLTLHAQTTSVGPYRFQSNAWVNLHQRLLYEARFGPETPPAGLSQSEQLAWNMAVGEYRTFLGGRSPINDAELIRLNASLSQVKSSSLPDSVPEPASAVLQRAMPLYRVAQWTLDDRANRFWIQVAEPMLASAGEELGDLMSKAYGAPWPKSIVVDVCSYAWEFGAYTVGEPDSAHVIIASIVPGNQGFAALEALVHEPSHVIVDGNSGAIGADINRAAAELHVKPRYNLWHAILFYTAGELTRRALAERGVPDYKPVMLAMYQRGFAGFRQPLETYWQAFLEGKISRYAAIRQIVNETSQPR